MVIRPVAGWFILIIHIIIINVLFDYFLYFWLPIISINLLKCYLTARMAGRWNIIV